MSDLVGTDRRAEQIAAKAATFDTDDAAEGVRSFLGKRPPEWRGR